jgi:parallel beta-helix repeat protein
VQKAENTLAPGQRALVRGGTYAQDVYANANGTATAPITIEAYPGERPVLRPGAGKSYALEIVGSYLRFRGFVLENTTGTSSTNIYLENPSHHVEISGNEIRFSQDQGIYVEGSTHDHRILGNDIHDNGLGHVSGQHQSHGIYLEGAHHLVANNVIHDQDYGFGIQVYPRNDGSIVTGNTVVANGYAGIVLGGSAGVRNVVVRNNVFAYNDQEGIAHDSTCATQSVADHNVLFGNGSGAIESGCTGVDRSGGNRTTDPLFLSLGARDLHIRIGSAAIDYGVPQWSPVTDHDDRGRTFGAGPDAGAYEVGL